MSSLPSKESRGITLGIVPGVLLLFSPLWINFFSAGLMILRSFQDLGSETPSLGPEELSGHVRLTFHLTLIGFLLSPLGAGVLIASLWLRRKGKAQKPGN